MSKKHKRAKRLKPRRDKKLSSLDLYEASDWLAALSAAAAMHSVPASLKELSQVADAISTGVFEPSPPELTPGIYASLVKDGLIVPMKQTRARRSGRFYLTEAGVALLQAFENVAPMPTKEAVLAHRNVMFASEDLASATNNLSALADGLWYYSDDDEPEYLSDDEAEALMRDALKARDALADTIASFQKLVTQGKAMAIPPLPNDAVQVKRT